MEGIAGWRVSSFLVGRGSSSWEGLFDTGFLVCMGWAGACE